ncbi:MAG: TldD/PmbA family protein [bacterium]
MTMSTSDLGATAERLLDLAHQAGAEEVQVRAERETERRVSFERGALHLATAGAETRFSIRVHKDQRLGAVQTNSVSDDDLREAVRAALDLARFSPPDQHLTMPAARPFRPTTRRYDPALAALDAGGLQRLASRYLGALKRDPRVSVESGSVSWEVGEICIANSYGVRASDTWTHAAWTALVEGIDGDEVTSFDYESGGAFALAGIDERIVADGEQLAGNVLATFGAGKGITYKGPVLLTPRAVGELLLEPLEFHLSGLSVLYGKSSLGDDRRDTAIASPLLTVRDDPSDLMLAGATPFDDEGVPTQPLDLVRAGRLVTHIENAYSAKRRGRPLTGHARLGLHAAVVEPGFTSAAELARGATPILAVHRFSGNVTPASGDFSGIAKSSHLLMPDGERRPVRETMIAGNFFDALRGIVAVGEASAIADGSFRAPHVLVDGISVTSE